LVLPSPNGSTLSFAAAAHGSVISACLRNRAAVCEYLNRQREPIAVIASGERWATDRSLRPCLEDNLGAGAVIAGLSGRRSPEAETAAATFEAVKDRLRELLQHCSSGRELIEKGVPLNVQLATELDVSDCVPLLRDGYFTRA
jgi:2-phosphosulfolactate phosphatase